MTRRLALSLVAACWLAPGAAAAAAKNPDIFTHLTIGNVDSLDPAWSYGSYYYDLSKE